jgi:hypothetical protein
MMDLDGIRIISGITREKTLKTFWTARKGKQACVTSKMAV